MGSHRPALPGADTFTGKLVHTAAWPEDLRLEGLRVAVVGTGASAMQVVPAIGEVVDRLYVLQRSPHWIAPFEKFGQTLPDSLQALMTAVPLYQRWDRIRWEWIVNDRVHRSLQKDPFWDYPHRAVSAENDEHRRALVSYIESELADRPDLVAAVTPTYPPFGKRMLLDNGWYRTLKRNNVELVAAGVEALEGRSVICSNGQAIEVDLLVLATGFHARQFLAPMEIRGRSGLTLRSQWGDDDARAYLGTWVPGFPNFAVMFGPNIKPGHGGSVAGLAESQAAHIVNVLRKTFCAGAVEVECRASAFHDYVREVDVAHENMIWTHPGMSTFYRNAQGRIVVPGPFRVIDVWQRLRNANADDFQFA